MNPWPPKIWVASRAFTMAASEATSLAMAASFLNGRPATKRVAASYQASRAVVSPGLHVGQFELEGLVFADFVPRHLPPAHIGQALVDAPLGQADRQCRYGDPALVQDLQELGIAATLLTQ